MKVNNKKLILIIIGMMLIVSGCNANQEVESPKMVIIKAGTTSQDNGNLTLDYDLKMGKYEVTFAEYISYCEDTGREIPADQGWGRGERPVANVSWTDAVAYCNWLSKKRGLETAYNTNGPKKTWELKDEPQKLAGYRLPTKLEWEYAARGGSKGKATVYAGSDKVYEVAWYDFNSDFKTHEVGRKKANELGLYDMSGNVWEWTTSQKNSKRIQAGGSYNNVAHYCKISSKHSYNQYSQDPGSDLGFRIVKTEQ